MDDKKYYYKIKSKYIASKQHTRVPVNSSELVVLQKAKNLAKYIFQITEKSPKKFRFTFVSRLQNLALDCVENIFRANNLDKTNVDTRYCYQKNAQTCLAILEYIALTSKEFGCITEKNYEQIAKMGAECQILLSAWTDSTKKASNK